MAKNKLNKEQLIARVTNDPLIARCLRNYGTKRFYGTLRTLRNSRGPGAYINLRAQALRQFLELRARSEAGEFRVTKRIE